jgi:periplasmic protein TonB
MASDDDQLIKGTDAGENASGDGEGEEGGGNKWLPVALSVVAFIAILAGLYFFFQSIQGLEPAPPPKIQEISVVQPPPPPPPPPEPEEPEPEPEEPEPEEEIEEPEPEPEEEAPEPEAEAPPPGPDLGLDAEGGVGSDGFGLVGKPGGKGIIGGGGTGTVAGWYTGVLQRDLQGLLEKQDDLRKKKYSVVVRLWLSADGRVERSQLDSSTGDPALDATIESTLNSGFRVSEKPPEAKFQAVKIRLTSRI